MIRAFQLLMHTHFALVGDLSPTFGGRLFDAWPKTDPLSLVRAGQLIAAMPPLAAGAAMSSLAPLPYNRERCKGSVRPRRARCTGRGANTRLTSAGEHMTELTTYVVGRKRRFLFAAEQQFIERRVIQSSQPTPHGLRGDRRGRNCTPRLRRFRVVLTRRRLAAVGDDRAADPNRGGRARDVDVSATDRQYPTNAAEVLNSTSTIAPSCPSGFGPDGERPASQYAIAARIAFTSTGVIALGADARLRSRET